MKIAIINGPNLKFIGQREINIYGKHSLKDLRKYILANIHNVKDLELDIYQSNSEGKLIDYIEEFWINKGNGIVINAGAYTHTSIALADCLKWINIPYIEVHLSNVYARESFRHKSFIAENAVGVICGFGIDSYVLGVEALIKKIKVRGG